MKIVSPGAATVILKGLVSSSVRWIVSEYIMKVPESLVNVWEVRRERPDKDIAQLTDSAEVATVEPFQAPTAFCVTAYYGGAGVVMRKLKENRSRGVGEKYSSRGAQWLNVDRSDAGGLYSL